MAQWRIATLYGRLMDILDQEDWAIKGHTADDLMEFLRNLIVAEAVKRD